MSQASSPRLDTLTLRAPRPADRPGFVEATILPARGFMLLQARIAHPDGRTLDALLTTPQDEALRKLDGGPDDFAGNASFSFGGAVLLPYANRIRGRALPDSREIETRIAGRPARLPRNWGGKADGAAQYAMHGLILDKAFTSDPQTDPASATGRLDAGDFEGRWPGRARVAIQWSLLGGALHLDVEVANSGETPLPIGIGWHPWFRLEGDRTTALLSVPARQRIEVDDYDQVLPTGRKLDVAGTPYDFRAGRALGELYLDDCFTGLEPGADRVRIADLEGEGLEILYEAPPVTAVQVYAPLDRPVIAVEPQFNLADPFGAVWPKDVDTGMQMVAPGGSTAYRVSVRPFTDKG